MFISIVTIIAASTVAVNGLAIKARDTCNWRCPPSDTASEALVVGGDWNGVLICDYSLNSNQEGLTASCEYNLSNGQFLSGYVNCPSSAVTTYSCPPIDSIGDALVVGGYDAGGVWLCGYGPAPGNADTGCYYSDVTGVLEGAFGIDNCPATAAC